MRTSRVLHRVSSILDSFTLETRQVFDVLLSNRCSEVPGITESVTNSPYHNIRRERVATSLKLISRGAHTLRVARWCYTLVNMPEEWLVKVLFLHVVNFSSRIIIHRPSKPRLAIVPQTLTIPAIRFLEFRTEARIPFSRRVHCGKFCDHSWHG